MRADDVMTTFNGNGSVSDLDRKGVELAWARATPLLKEFFGVEGTSIQITAIVTLLTEPIIEAYLSGTPSQQEGNQG